MQTQAIAPRRVIVGVGGYAATSLVFLVASLLLSRYAQAPLVDSSEIVLRPVLGLAIVLLLVFGWSFLPIAWIGLLLESAHMAIGVEYWILDSAVALLVAAYTAKLIRDHRGRTRWGTQRELLVFGICAFILPVALAGEQVAFVQPKGIVDPFWVAWIAAVAPITAIVPAGIKFTEWLLSDRHESFWAYLAQGARPEVQAAQWAFLLLAAVFFWVERVAGANARVFPLLIGIFWVAITSGLTGATWAFLVAECLLVLVNGITHYATKSFDIMLSSTFMGSAALVAGALVTAQKSAQERLREQGEALRRQLSEMQVIRRLADSIIALRDESALYELGAEAIGERIRPDQVWLLSVASGSSCATEVGFWSEQPKDRLAPDLEAVALAPIWMVLEESRTDFLSRADRPNEKLFPNGLDVMLHQASGIVSLVFHPFSFEPSGFRVAAALSYRRMRSWSDEDIQFIATVCDQITIAAQKTKLLQEREDRSRSFARMTQALVAETGQSFFRNLVLRLAEAAETRGAYILRREKDPDRATMLAISDGGAIRADIPIDLAGMPTADILETGSLALIERAEQQFPALAGLTECQIEGFASVRLEGSTGPLGTLAIYHDKRLDDPGHIAAILPLFAARASSEMERSQRELLLKESEAGYRRLLETAHEGIWIIDAEGRITYVNAMMASLLGVPAEEMVGRGIQDFVEVGDRIRIDLELQRKLAGTAAQLDLQFRRHDGSSVWTLLSLTPIRDQAEQFRGALGMVIDISERKQTERDLDRLVQERTVELVASNRELEAFCYSISHDLRQPLRAIDGFSKAAVEDLGESVPEDVKEHLARVRRGANRMSELIDALLTLSRLTRVEMHRERADLSRIATTILGELKAADPNRRGQAIVQPGLAVMGDPRLLHIALENLLSNAWKFSSIRTEPAIEFGSRKMDGETWLFVRDNGIGFDMAYSNKLFKPFERLHSGSEFYGTGIGLATVARVITRHGGRIAAEGEVGKGATFSFTLPEIL